MIAATANAVKVFVLRVNDRLRLNMNVLLALGVVAQHSFVLKFAAFFVLLVINAGDLLRMQPRRIPLFYAVIPLLEVLKLLFLSHDLSAAHLAQFSIGMVYWIAAFLLCWILYITAAEKYVHRSIALIAILNFVFSFAQYLRVCFIEGTPNPFNTGHNHPYGISTGDLIYGLFQGVHLTNTFVSLLLSVYFLYHSNYWLLGISVFCLLLTGNNYGTIVFAIAMIIMFVTQRGARRWAIAISLAASALYYVFITPFNAEYMIEKILHISVQLPNAGRDIGFEQIEKANEYEIVNVPDTFNPYDVEGTTAHKVVVRRAGTADSAFDFVKQSGKIRAYYQTLDFLSSSVPHMLFGAGMGGFSSKLAFNSSGVMEGSTLNKVLPKYETSWFRDNHKAIYAYLKTQHIMFHSESNRPFSVYNQLAGEYGLVGLVLFIVLYLWYFLRRISLRTYALPCFVALLFILNLDYFIESLSLLLFFELLMFIDIRGRHQAE